MKLRALIPILPLLWAAALMAEEPNACVTCHTQATPGIVQDWRLSKHAGNEIACDTCHGTDHSSAADAAKAKLPTPAVCTECHATQVKQFSAGKHALAWAAMKAVPTAHAQPVALMEGMKGCGGCHKIGLKTEAEIQKIKADSPGFGVASCDACHTRHSFSVKEARQPQACQTCHMGFDHPQWEMYSASKHGVRALLKQNGILPASAAGPTCQDCHMQDGDHEVRTPWGFLGVRLPLPENPQWKADQVTILQALGVLDPQGNPTPRLEVVKALQMARLDGPSFEKERAKLVGACAKCHSRLFAEGEIRKGDDMIREADRLMAEAIRTVAGLYEDGTLKKPAGYAAAFPDLLAFHDAPTSVEHRLFLMFSEHRMRAFQGTFHANPDYALWYGWSEMVRDLIEIKETAARMRAEKRRE